MDLDSITRIVELMSEHELSEFSLEEEGKSLCIKKGGVVPIAAPVATPAPVQAAQSPAAEPEAQEPVVDENVVEITAPFVGTFYRAPAPDAEVFVSIGQKVTSDTVLCILEAMKVMNEIKAEMSGVVREICVNNAEPVQFGQPLFKIQKQ